MADDDEAVLEVEPGSWDGSFARASAIATGLLLAVLLVGVGWAVIALPRAAGHSAVAILAVELLLVLTAIGGALLLLGFWLAALETRGRLPKSTVRHTRSGVGSMVDSEKAGKAVAAVIDSLSKARGTIAVLASGLIVVTLAGIGAIVLAAGPARAPAVPPSQSPSGLPTPANSP